MFAPATTVDTTCCVLITPPGIYYDHTVITLYYTSLSIPYPFPPYPPPPSPPLPPTHPPPFPHFSNIPSPTFPLSLTPPPPLPSSLLPLLANRGKAAMVPVGVARTTGILQIEFQRQKYFYTPPNKLGSAAKEFPHGVFTLSACPTDLPLVYYTSARYDPFLFSTTHTNNPFSLYIQQHHHDYYYPRLMVTIYDHDRCLTHDTYPSNILTSLFSFS